MAGINKVILIGHLGRDPELRYMQNGSPVASLNIATSRRWKNKQTNEMVEETEWHRVSVFGVQAEHCNNYLAKGRMVYVEGRLKTRSYEDKEGVKRYATDIIAENVQFLSGRGEGGDSGRGGGGGGGGGRGAPSGGRGRGDAGESGGGGPEPYDPGDYAPSGPEDDDIPF